MGAAGTGAAPFALRDCSLISLATGVRVQGLRELRDQLERVDRGSIYHHFWGRMLRPHFTEPEFNNDFASWVHDELREPALAERLGVVNPADFASIDELRQELIEIVESALDAAPWLPLAGPEGQFHFVRSHVVVFDTGRRVSDPRELAAAVPRLSAGSIFYHFIDARRRTPGREDDFRAWLAGFGGEHAGLAARLAAIDPFFSTLPRLREHIGAAFAAALGEDGHE